MVDDLCSFPSFGLLLKNEIFNVGYQNMSIKDIADLVKKVIEKVIEEFL